MSGTAGEPYTARASVGDGVIDGSTGSVTGDRSGGLWTTDSGMEKDDFLLLLVTQMRFQDPLNPMDNNEMLAQMSQLRQLEGINNMESAITGLKESFSGTVEAQASSATAISNAAAVSLIGREVRLRETSVYFSGREADAVSMQVHLGNRAAAAVQILDADGTVVRTLQAVDKDAENSAAVTWDGRDETGALVKQGSYTIAIEGEQSDASLYAFVEAMVQGIRLSSTGAMVKVDGRELPVGNLMDVSMTDADTSFGSLSQDSALALLGKQIRMRRDTVTAHAVDNENIEIRVNLAGLASAEVEIVDAKGQVVNVLTVSDVADAGRDAADGTGVAVWNGRVADSQDFAPAGQYRIRIRGSQTNAGLYAYTEGAVEGISTSGGLTRVQIGGQYYSLSQILEVTTVKTGNQEETV